MSAALAGYACRLRRAVTSVKEDRSSELRGSALRGRARPRPWCKREITGYHRSAEVSLARSRVCSRVAEKNLARLTEVDRDFSESGFFGSVDRVRITVSEIRENISDAFVMVSRATIVFAIRRAT